jgi:IS30 family transposase
VGRLPMARVVRMRFWEEVRAGRLVYRAARAVGVSQPTGRRWFVEAGGVIGNAPGELGCRYLSVVEREEISRGLAGGDGVRVIARRLGRAASTVSREIARNGGRRRYRAFRADVAARERARRPKIAVLAGNAELREWVQAWLEQHWSPRQIATRLAGEFPTDQRMRVSHETIYQSLYVQGRGALRRELAACLRTGRALRVPRRQAQARRARPPLIPDLIEISERPAEAADRAIPGHWEGDLLIGKNNRSAIGTLVERATRFCVLVHLPNGYTAVAVRDAMIRPSTPCPPH